MINKTALLALLLLAIFQLQAQRSDLFINVSESDCGHWAPKDIVYSEWIPVDTLKSNPVKDTIRDWLYDEEHLVGSNNISLAVYCPCGCGHPKMYIRRRVCLITGIVEVRYKTQFYEYVPKPKNEYQKTIENLNNKQ